MISNVVNIEAWADQVEETGEFTTALDSIDASMKTDPSSKEANRQEVTITREALAKIVGDAVAGAIAAYERALGLAPQPARAPQLPTNAAPTPASPWRTKLERLQGDMGLNEIEFNDVPVDLAAEMGIDGFGFNDAPPRAAEPTIPTEVPIDGVELMPTAAALSAWDEELKQIVPEPPAPAISVPLQWQPTPAPATLASSMPFTPEEAAATIFFTFDPMPPVPSPIPREPRKD